ncbi:hypothetical protein DENSPDRAFT_934734 [Dentipellis sp. KUC8613]|nr:hypothetical protein DENSPDRAFT_934734 [Dentipellis sp. KUC8613]
MPLAPPRPHGLSPSPLLVLHHTASPSPSLARRTLHAMSRSASMSHPSDTVCSPSNTIPPSRTAATPFRAAVPWCGTLMTPCHALVTLSRLYRAPSDVTPALARRPRALQSRPRAAVCPHALQRCHLALPPGAHAPPVRSCARTVPTLPL